MDVQRRGRRPEHNVEHVYKLRRRAWPNQFLQTRHDVRDRLVLSQEVILDLLGLLQHRFGVLVGVLSALVLRGGLNILSHDDDGQQDELQEAADILGQTKWRKLGL